MSSGASAGVPEQLEHYGYRTLFVEQADALERALQRRQPVALVFEFSSAGETQAGCAEIMRMQLASVRRCPALVISSAADFATRYAAAKAGVDAYLLKPVDASLLAEMLDSLVRGGGEPYRVLVVDDGSGDAAHTEAMLSHAGMEVFVLHKPDEILPTLQQFHPELILMNQYMPEYSGADLARLIRQDRACFDIPIVFLSSDQDPALQAAALQSGADNFLGKPVQPQHLLSLVSSRAERYRVLRGLAMRDALTGAYSHSAIKEHLQREIARVGREASKLALALVDLDGLKAINDACGPAEGDQVIRALARLLQQRLRQGDFIGRYSGERFLLILPGATLVSAFNVLEQVRLGFSSLRHHLAGKDIAATFSAGITSFSGDDNPDALLNEAGEALRQAKARGRNCIQMG
jgi:diguanylate cyclase (GGDEF)-like protein